jgi:DNA-binding SARP family transcriptional activator
VQIFIGDPMPSPDPVRHAVSAAIEIRDAVANIGADLPEAHDLTVAVGVSFGYATLGVIGYEGRHDYSAIGPVVDLARLICTAAPAGEIRCSAKTAARCKDYAGLDDLGAVELAPHLPPVQQWTIRGLQGNPPASADEPELDIRLLGPLEIRYRGADVPIRAARVRRLLGLLLLHRGRVVSVDRLVDEIWEHEPPDSALAALRVHVSRLRKMLATAGLENLLVTRPTGYLLDVPEASVDADRFEALIAEARAAVADGDPKAAVARFRRALEMWRGAALAGIASSTNVEAEAARLEEARLAAFEDCISAELEADNARAVLGELEAMIVEHPLRERLWGLRMLALYRAGRQADALECYQSLRRHLDEELGLEPSADLARLHQDILQQAPSLLIGATAR